MKVIIFSVLLVWPAPAIFFNDGYLSSVPFSVIYIFSVWSVAIFVAYKYREN